MFGDKQQDVGLAPEPDLLSVWSSPLAALIYGGSATACANRADEYAVVRLLEWMKSAPRSEVLMIAQFASEILIPLLQPDSLRSLILRTPPEFHYILEEFSSVHYGERVIERAAEMSDVLSRERLRRLLGILKSAKI